MKLSIMPPYFFPYIGYFQLMKFVDRWIVFDDIKFANKSWINRNRILHPNPEKKWQYINIPVKRRKQFDKIRDVSVNNETDWRKAILGKLTHYKNIAPYYDDTINHVEECLAVEGDRLGEILVRCLELNAKKLGISTRIDVQSETIPTLDKVNHSGQWALRISEFLGADEYVNPYGGADIFNESEFSDSKIKLSFIKPKLTAYPQRNLNHVTGLSILDIMMWNDISTINTMLTKDYECLTKNELITSKEIQI